MFINLQVNYLFLSDFDINQNFEKIYPAKAEPLHATGVKHNDEATGPFSQLFYECA